jgi:hypothetical protein
MAFVISQKAARALTRIVRGASDATAPTYSSATISPDDYPPPFTVRWSQSESSGEGAWVIWLPDTSQLVMHDKAYLTPSGISAASVLPSGWYTISGIESDSEEVWLVAHIPDPDATGSPSAEFSDSEGQATTGESVINLLVAQLESDDNTGAKRVKQFVDSTVVFGGGTGGESVSPDDVSTEFIPHDPAQGADNTHEGELQIKGWNTGTPTSANTLAQELEATGSTPTIVVRDGGTLKYMSIGHLQNTLPTNTVDVVTGISYAIYNGDWKLRITKQPLGISNGQFTLGQEAYSYIDTTPLSQEWTTAT